MMCRWVVWERAEFGGVDDTCQNDVENDGRIAREYEKTGIEFNSVDDALPGSVGVMTSPCSAILMMSLMAR
jgi:hypothetical protein